MKPLAFIIITYNRPDDALELLKNIAQLDKTDELLEEVIVVNNASTADYSQLEAYIRSTPQLPVHYHFSNENLGVARGRNLAISKSRAPVLIMLDDDAVLQNKDAFVKLLKEYERENTSRPKAIVSFKVLYFDTLAMQQNALPHKQFATYKDKPFFETYYYAGGAHAIKREAIDKVGSYPTDFFYGMEEYDLSYRLLDAGYGIVYSDAVVMLHKESPLGRKPKEEKMRMMWVNKAKVAWRYLPKKYFYSTVLMWAFEYLRRSGFNLAGLKKGFDEISHIPQHEQRRTVSMETISYLRSVNARLWY